MDTSLATEVADAGPGAVETNDSIREKCEDHQNPLGILDAIWASVQGTEEGLLSTDQQLDFLGWTVLAGMDLWIRVNGDWHNATKVASCL